MLHASGIWRVSSLPGRWFHDGGARVGLDFRAVRESRCLWRRSKQKVWWRFQGGSIARIHYVFHQARRFPNVPEAGAYLLADSAFVFWYCSKDHAFGTSRECFFFI